MRPFGNADHTGFIILQLPQLSEIFQTPEAQDRGYGVRLKQGYKLALQKNAAAVLASEGRQSRDYLVSEIGSNLVADFARKKLVHPV